MTAPVTAATPTTKPTTTTPASTTTANSTLGKNDFLKLLVAQLKYQNPMSPTDPSSFMAQTAQFSMVEKLEQMAADSSELLTEQRWTTATALLGRQITWTAADALYASHPSKAFAFPEWGIWGFDDPQFVRRMAGFVRKHPRTEFIAYYSGRPGSVFDLTSKRASLAAYRALITPLG